MYEMANMATTWVEVQWTFVVRFNVTHNEGQTIIILKDIIEKKYESWNIIMTNFYNYVL
jgi:hypothetical protein